MVLAGRPECFSATERQTLIAIAQAAMPKGRYLPQASAESVAQVEAFVATQHRALIAAYKSLLHALDAWVLASTLKPFRQHDELRREKLLNDWRTSDSYLRRSALRALLVPLKLAHFGDPELFRRLGCLYETHPPAAAPPRYITERVTRAADLESAEELECDVVVVGTGAGGAVVAKELAEQGHAVILIEEGEYFTREHFTGRALPMQKKLYRDAGTTMSIGNVAIPIPIGVTVGGTTTVNSGTCYRVPRRVLRKWREEHGLSEFGPESLTPYFERVEAILGVERAKPEHLGPAADVIARGCDKLGYRHRALLRNAPDCDGQGVCCFGCPTEAKRSTNVSYVPLALKAGAHLFTGARVEKVLVHGQRTLGVVARAPGGHRSTLTVRARKTVLACGAFGTPLLLLRHELANRSGQVGKNLSIHPAVPVAAWFDEPTHPFGKIPQGYSIEEFHDEGLLFEGATTPVDMAAATLSLVGRRYVELVETLDHAVTFGFMIEDTSRGRVRPSRLGRPLITYYLNDRDVARIKRGVEILARVFFAAGASRVLPLVHGFDELRGERDLSRFRAAHLAARDFDLSAYHPLGTARMGRDPKSSVVGPDHKAHDLADLYIADGSAVPSSLAVNPQLTIMALSTRCAEAIGRTLG